MCGINGFTGSDARLAARMNVALKHRGPDDSGVHATRDVTLAQVRLSIIDLSPAGHQPMFYDRRFGASSATHHPERIARAKLSIVFNGEIYNYLEIKDELEEKGYRFSTRCDTEVILAAYLEWGYNCVRRFNGMWAFCIHDTKAKTLFCSRDRLGVKPFHYYLGAEGTGGANKRAFVFSSELKGILAHTQLRINRKENVSKEAMQLYVALGFIPAPLTIYSDVFKLEASHNLVFDLAKGAIRRRWRYYDIPNYRPSKDRKSLIAEGRAILKDAVRLRMIADVPVGAFLSGGLDSSSVVGEMRDITELSKLHTFSIGFEGKYDESHYVTIVKDYFKTLHHHQYFKEKDLRKLLPAYSWVYDEPFADFSGFPTYAVAKLAREHVTVCLSGDGGDEIFGGYAAHVMGARMDLLRKLPRILRSLGARLPARKSLDGTASLHLLKEACRISLLKPEEFYAAALEQDAIKPESYKRWTREKLAYALSRGDGKMGEALRLHDLAFNTLADNFLTKVDRASMAHALEVRSPFLDYRFIEYAQRIPTEWKASPLRTKRLLREIIKDIVPKEIVQRGKQGFTPPLTEWIGKEEYAPAIANGLCALATTDPALATVFEEKILKEHHRFAQQYRIRLFILGEWWGRWIRE